MAQPARRPLYSPETFLQEAATSDRRNNLFLLAVAALTVTSLLVIWPQKPSNYVPEVLPLPGSAGLHIDFLGFRFDRQGFRLGLDLQGGTHLILQADTSRLPADSDKNAAVEGALSIIERRINAYGVAEPIVQRQGTDRIIVDLPGVRNIEEAKNLIGKTAQLDFREQKTVEGKQEWILAVAPLNGVDTELTGAYFKKAEVGFEQNTSKPEILFQFNSDGASMFGQVTTRLKGKQLGIFLDGNPITTPTVQETIRDQGRITGSFTLDEARALVIQLNAGALPLPVSIQEERTVNATLGEDSVRKSVVAGEIGLIIVAAFMLLYYRVLGIVAVSALFVYTLFLLAIFKLLPVTLTLAGIAGFILSIGMAVDANILIFERMKEELRTGKTVGAAIDAGFTRAWSSIRDSNISTLITCGILYAFGANFGASIVMGFALTLAIGVGVSMFSAIVVSRGLLQAAMAGRPTVNPTYLGMPANRPRTEAIGAQV
ncbi:MAG: protein translocase subunit SecD [Chloroflexi bacterium]|nr:protein translocase subunit SecD [Chloroflexota bacterium]